MIDYFYKPIRIGKFKTSEIELKDLAIAWLAISLAFSIAISGLNFAKITIAFPIALLVVGLGFVCHDLPLSNFLLGHGFSRINTDTSFCPVGVASAPTSNN